MTNKKKNSIETVPKWEIVNHRLCRQIKTKNYLESVDIVNQITPLAEDMDHHPDIEFGWGYVRINLITHSQNKISSLDTELAKKINHTIG